MSESQDSSESTEPQSGGPAPASRRPSHAASALLRIPAVEGLLRRSIESRLDSEGLWWLRIREIRLDPAERRLHAMVELEGEEFPIEISASYRFDDDAILIEDIETSKSWMSHAAALALARHGGRLPLPGGITGRLIRSLL